MNGKMDKIEILKDFFLFKISSKIQEINFSPKNDNNDNFQSFVALYSVVHLSMLSIFTIIPFTSRSPPLKERPKKNLKGKLF